MGYKKVLISDLSEEDINCSEPVVYLDVRDRYIEVGRLTSISPSGELETEKLASPDVTYNMSTFTLREFVALFGYDIVPKSPVVEVKRAIHTDQDDD